MASITFRNGEVLSDFGKPYIVAEMNMGHTGKIDLAKKMVLTAQKCGCDCVKFQSWTSKSLYSKVVYESNPIAKRIANRFSLSEEKLLEVKQYCDVIGITFSSTPYDKAEVDYLVDVCDAPYVKVASMDLNNYPFLEYIASKQTPIVLSTGMADLEEIRKAVKTIFNAGNRQVCLLHCVAEYPPELESINLNNIYLLRSEFPECPIGLSDHSAGVEISTAAVALGVCMIEKHFTLDKKARGWDNEMAMEPDEMKQLVNNSKNVFTAMGSHERIIGSGEMEQRRRIRRSVVATRNIAAGSVLKEDDLDCKRPGTGIPPEKMKSLIGRKILRNITADEMIMESDLEERY